MSAVATYLWPGQTHIDTGAVSQVGPKAKGAGAKTKVCVVTDQGIVAAGLVQHVLDSIRAAGLTAETFDKTPPNPSSSVIDIGLPLRLCEAAVSEEMIPELANHASKDLNWLTNPRAISRNQMGRLYRGTF